MTRKNPSRDELLSTFPEVKARGGKYEGNCPLCGGKNKFAIFEREREWHLHCVKCGDDKGLWDEYRSRVATGTVVVREHEPPEPTAPKPWDGPGPGRTVVARYDYTDAFGRATGTKLRIEPGYKNRPKDFIWIHGANLLGRPSSDRHLYRRRELAQRPNAVVFLVEGEKCVHTMQAALDAAGLDAIATCPSDGAKSKPTPYAGQLSGRVVVMLPDNDKPGLDMAQAWGPLVRREAESFAVRNLDGLPEKGDIVDWLAAGGDVRTLMPKAPEAPPPWLTDAPIPDDPGIWDSPDHSVAPTDEPPDLPEAAYRLASTGNVYVLVRGEWMLHHHTAAWQWCYEQNHMLDGKERSKAATHQSKTIPRAFSLDMDCTSKEPVVVRDGLPHLNTFRGIMEPGQPGDFSTICDHLNFMFGVDTEAQNWMLDWFATWYQPIISGRGAFRSECMPLLYGTTGTGKGLLIRMLKHIVGAKHTIKVKGSSIDDKFTPAGINNALLYVIDELNDPKSLDVIKTFITEPDPSKRDMHVAETGFRSNLNLLATSNLIRPIQLAADDRRIAVIRLRESMPRDLATRIVDHERAGYPELPAFLRFLADRRIPAGVPMRPLDNADRDALITLSKPPHIEFLEDLRDLGAESVVSDYANAHPNMTLGRWHSTPDAAGLVSVGISTLAAAYKHWCNQRSKRAIDASLVVSEATSVIPTARATSKTGVQGIQVKIAGKNVRCIAGVPLGGTGIAEQTEAAATEPHDWQLPPTKIPPNRA